jgi:endonuclease I/methionine-rich copper-binding protein CopC
MYLRSCASRALVSLIFLAAAPAAMAQYVPLVGGTPATQSFDTLAASGTGTAVPNGWYFVETGTNANTTYAADDGTANSGNTYSYGSVGSSERAFGTLRSGSLIPTIGARLRNDTGAALSEIAVAYTGEQWRLGATGRADRLQFQYSLTATSLGDTAATWIDVSALDFSSPVTTGSIGALNGNLAANRTAISGSISGLNLAADASLWVRWVDIDVSGADDGLAIDDVSFAVAGDPPPDVPPTVTSTTPANNATGVALNAPLTVRFSEAVTLTNPWFTLNCAASGSHTATVSGGPVTFTLAPSPAFAASESCTWTILASGVTDQDGTPDPLQADVVVAFTTLDPGSLPPPTVISTQPANGASNVPMASDVRVTFSEAVTTTANAFELACNSTPITLTETGSGATRTLTPATVLQASANCAFTVNASGVRNAGDIAMAQSVTTSFTVTSGTNNAYYSQVNTTSAPQLRCSLHATIRGHTAYPYSGSGTSTWTILETAQANPANPNQILDVYRNRLYTAISGRAGTGTGLTYNREHTWPNSLGFPSTTGNLGKPNAPYTDTHMLYLSDTQWNSDRSNKPYANCPTSASCGERATESNGGIGGGTGVYPGNSNWTNSSSFQTWSHRKGDVARAIFYMAIRYEGGVDPTSGQNEPDLELTDNRSLIVGTSNYNAPAYMGLLADLLAWHESDPPDADELARNQVIYTFQGNRNPFIDHPEWATRALFESARPTTCELNQPSDVIFANGFEQ